MRSELVGKRRASKQRHEAGNEQVSPQSHGVQTAMHGGRPTLTDPPGAVNALRHSGLERFLNNRTLRQRHPRSHMKGKTNRAPAGDTVPSSNMTATGTSLSPSGSAIRAEDSTGSACR